MVTGMSIFPSMEPGVFFLTSWGASSTLDVEFEIIACGPPRECPRGARAREGLTQKQLSGITGVPARHISEMENGKRPIGKAMAKRLGTALGVGYKVFL